MITWHPALEEDDPSPALRPLGERPKATAFQVVREVPALLALAVLLAFLIKTFAAQAFYIPSASMEPQLRRGDRVVVSKLSYDLHDVRRGDIIVFDAPVPKPPDRSSAITKFLRGLLQSVGIAQPSTEE